MKSARVIIPSKRIKWATADGTKNKIYYGGWEQFAKENLKTSFSHCLYFEKQYTYSHMKFLVSACF